MNKPPLGVKPAELHARQRIVALASAICRYAASDDVSFYDKGSMIRDWADELERQIEIAINFTKTPVIPISLDNFVNKAKVKLADEIDKAIMGEDNDNTL